MMEVNLVMSVPVIVTVDLQEHNISQVVVFDEAPAEWTEAATDSGRPKGGQVRRAIDIADEAMWPAWQFGF
jgi:hypothetical protein